MKSGAKSVAWVLSGILAVSVWEAHAVSTGDDGAYRSITARNIFDLQDPPKPTPPAPPPKQLPNVKLVGLITITGHPQAVIWSQEPGVPPKQPVTTVLLAGQREGNIEVIEIDSSKKQARVQVDTDTLMLSLEDKPSPSAPGAAMPAGVPGQPPRPVLPGAGYPGGATPVPGAPNMIRKQPVTGAYNPAPSAPGMPSGYGGYNAASTMAATDPASTPGLPTRPVRTDDTTQSQQPQLTPEQQMILMEAQREAATKAGDPIAQILPPTPLGALMQQQAAADAAAAASGRH